MKFRARNLKELRFAATKSGHMVATNPPQSFREVSGIELHYFPSHEYSI
jgi:hypothetical protein